MQQIGAFATGAFMMANECQGSGLVRRHSRPWTWRSWQSGLWTLSAPLSVQKVAEAEQVWFNKPLLLLDDVAHSQSEPRLHALGRTDQTGLLHLTFTLRGEGTLIMVISARDMHRRERAIYEQAV
jgi:uncharacterized DUF497 family protein